MGIAEGHRHRLVSEQLLHGAQIDPLHDEPTGKGVAEVVPAKILDLGLRERGPKDAAHVVVDVDRGFAGAAWEDVAALKTTVAGAEDFAHGVVHGNAARSAVLRPFHRDDAGREVDILPPQPKLLCLAEAGVEGEGHHRPLLVADHLPKTRFFLRREEPNALVVFPEELYLADGIRLDPVVGDRHVEDALQERELSVHGRRLHVPDALGDIALDVGGKNLTERLSAKHRLPVLPVAAVVVEVSQGGFGARQVIVDHVAEQHIATTDEFWKEAPLLHLGLPLPIHLES